jgi:hypothetical protein
MAELPGLRAIVRHALPNLVEATLVPLLLFYVTMATAGVWAGILSGLVWSYACLVRRIATGERVPGILVLGAVGLAARFAAAAATGSVFVFYAQPTLGTVLVGLAFLVSVPCRRPLAGRLAGDFVPVAPEVFDEPPVRRYLGRISVLWAAVHLLNAGVTLWLLLSQPVGVYMVAKTAVSWTVTGTAIAITVVTARRLAARLGYAVATDLVEQRGRRSRDRRAPVGVAPSHEVTVLLVDDHRTRLAAHEHPAEVVPRAVRVAAAVDVAVEAAGGDHAQVEGRGAEGAELPPAEVDRRPARQGDHRVAQVCHRRRRDRFAVERGALASHRFEPLPRGLVDDEGGGGPVPVEHAQARRVPGDAPGGVGGPVDGIDDDEQRVVGPAQPRLLAQHADPGGVEDTQRGLVGHEVDGVLADPVRARPPVDHAVERGLDRVGDVVEEVEHGGPP